MLYNLQFTQVFKEKNNLLRTFSQLLSVEANATKRGMTLKPRITSHCVYRYQLVCNTKIALLSQLYRTLTVCL